MAKKSKTDAFEAIHSAVAGMHKAGTITKETMRHFDETCIAQPEQLSPNEIKALRNQPKK